MKCLLDMPVSPSLVDVLRKFGHDGVHAYHIGHGRTADSDLLELARSEQRVVITADLDFPRILFLTAASGPGVILFRGGSYSDKEMCELLERVLSEVTEDAIRSSVCVVDKRHIRVTALPLKSR
ncbi:MAG: DUF5615 family PIN-like protein [bacterium]